MVERIELNQIAGNLVQQLGVPKDKVDMYIDNLYVALSRSSRQPPEMIIDRITEYLKYKIALKPGMFP